MIVKISGSNCPIPKQITSTVCDRCYYCHPTTRYEHFIDALNNSITEIIKNNQKLYLLGEFNVNLAEDSPNRHSNNLMNMLFSYSACPKITLPTRVTDNSETIIDNIITNDSNYILPASFKQISVTIT